MLQIRSLVRSVGLIGFKSEFGSLKFRLRCMKVEKRVFETLLLQSDKFEVFQNRLTRRVPRRRSKKGFAYREAIWDSQIFWVLRVPRRNLKTTFAYREDSQSIISLYFSSFCDSGTPFRARFLSHPEKSRPFLGRERHLGSQSPVTQSRDLHVWLHTYIQ